MKYFYTTVILLLVTKNALVINVSQVELVDILHFVLNVNQCFCLVLLDTRNLRKKDYQKQNMKL